VCLEATSWGGLALSLSIEMQSCGWEFPSNPLQPLPEKNGFRGSPGKHRRGVAGGVAFRVGSYARQGPKDAD